MIEIKRRYFLFCLLIMLVVISTIAPLSAQSDITSSLARFQGVHPRLFVSASDAAAVAGTLSSSRKQPWSVLKSRADIVAAEQPPSFKADEGEQLWQRDVGDNIATLAFTWLLTRDRTYLKAATDWGLTSCSYPTWGTGKTLNVGLVFGHQLLGLAMLYDYGYNDLSPTDRAVIHDTLLKRASQLYAGIEADPVNQVGYTRNSTWVECSGLLAAGFALFDTDPQAKDWITLCLNVLATSTKIMPPDGASQEGVGYWSYGMEHFLELADLGHEVSGVNSLTTDWWRNTGYYGLALLTPRNAWGTVGQLVDLEDCARYWSVPPAIFSRLATISHDGVMQWTAQQTYAANLKVFSTSRWLDVLWADPSIQPTPPSGLPLLRVFPEMGIVSDHSSWTGDESMVVYRCGSPVSSYIEKHWASYIHGMDLGHPHPDANHFVIFGDGDWLIRNVGYVTRRTDYHNTLLVDGAGQWQNGVPWPPLDHGRPIGIVETSSTPGIDTMVGEAVGAYPESDGLKKFTRRLYFVKPNVLIVADDIACNGTHKLDLLFHPEYPVVPQPDGSLLSTGPRSVLRIDPLTTSDVTVTSRETTILARNGKIQRNAATKQPTSLTVVDMSTSQPFWRNVVAFTWGPSGSSPAKAAITLGDSSCTVDVDGQKVPINWGS